MYRVWVWGDMSKQWLLASEPMSLVAAIALREECRPAYHCVAIEKIEGPLPRRDERTLYRVGIWSGEGRRWLVPYETTTLWSALLLCEQQRGCYYPTAIEKVQNPSRTGAHVARRQA